MPTFNRLIQDVQQASNPESSSTPSPTRPPSGIADILEAEQKVSGGLGESTAAHSADDEVTLAHTLLTVAGARK